MKKTEKMVWTVLFLFLMAPIIVSCGDNGDGTDVSNFNPPMYESVSGKYEINDLSSPYESIELGASGDYVVMKRNAWNRTRSSSQKKGIVAALTKDKVAGRAVTYNDVIYGSFTRLADGSFDLEGFGIITLIVGSNQQVTTIQIHPSNGDSPMSFGVKKAAGMGDDELTNALCRSWKVVVMYDKGYDPYEGEYEEVITPEEDPGNIASEIMFSKSGTFLVSFGGYSIDALFWKWENWEAGELRYSSDNIWYNGEEEGIFTVKFSGNKLILYEYYMDNEDGEWYESTIELVEKNPTTGGDGGSEEGGEGEVTPPIGEGPVGNVFTGKLLDELDDHGLDRFVYENGFLTEVLVSDYGSISRIKFDYNYLTANQENNEPDVCYTYYYADGSIGYVYEATLNAQGFVESAVCRHFGKSGDFQFSVNCEYDSEGHLVRMYEGREERDYLLTWQDGDLVQVEYGEKKNVTQLVYSEELNSNNLMFFYDVYNLDIEELKYLYWAGLLGVSPKHLVIASSRKYDNGYTESSEYKWEANRLMRLDSYRPSWQVSQTFTFRN